MDINRITTPKVSLLASIKSSFSVAELAAKTCYSSDDVSTLIDTIKKDGYKSIIPYIKESGHLSPLEHISFTFSVEGVSRVLSHQLVRHRLASFSQKSQRYVKEGGFEYIIPDTIKKDKNLSIKYISLMNTLDDFYEELKNCNIPNEDARYILPNACETKLIVTMNARELLHFFELRCCNRSQWEIRNVANKMLSLCKEVEPIIFNDAGAPCLRNRCIEKNPCKKSIKNK